MRYTVIAATMLFATTSVWAGVLSNNDRYQQTHFEIKNNTTYVEWVRIYDFEGVWKKPVVDNLLFTLKPFETYSNTLTSVVENKGVENDTSIAVVRKDSPRDNYLIFGESTESWRHDVLSDIFDGLGDMFVDSWTNHCDEITLSGYPNCKLIIKDKS